MTAGDTATPAARLRRMAVELAGLAQTGATFAQNHYDIDRYTRIGEISSELLSLLTGEPLGDISSILAVDGGYATPHVDVRGALFDGDRVLLVREASDGLWTLPGGWADVLDTPRPRPWSGSSPRRPGCRCAPPGSPRSTTGTSATATWSPGRRSTSGSCSSSASARIDAEPEAGLDGETTDVGFFGLDELPPLSTRRVNEAQLRRLAAHHREPALPVEAD